MPEPLIPAAAAGTGAFAVTLTGSILGIQYDALAIALFGGMAALMYLPTMDSHLKKFMSVVVASLFGGLFSPVASAGALYYVNWLHTVDNLLIRLSCAFALGLVAQVSIPTLLSLIKRKGDEA